MPAQTVDPIARLDEAVLWPQGESFAERHWVDATPGAIVTDLMAEAHARGALSDVSADTFSADHDSDGAAWQAKVSTAFQEGITYLRIVDQLAAMGVVQVHGLSTDGRLLLRNGS